jgi:hypothetical protein
VSEKVRVEIQCWVSCGIWHVGNRLGCCAELYTSTKRGGRVGQGSLVQVQGRGAGSMLLLLVLGIVMLVM